MADTTTLSTRTPISPELVRTTQMSHLYVVEPGIVHHIYEDNSIVDLEEAHKVVKLTEELLGSGVTFRVLNDIRAKVAFTREARDFFRNHSEDTIMAFLINSKIGEVAVNFFLKFNNPPFKLKIFNDEQEALEWLRTAQK